MPVYKFSHQLLAVLVHLAHTAIKWKTNFLTLDIGDKLVNTKMPPKGVIFSDFMFTFAICQIFFI